MASLKWLDWNFLHFSPHPCLVLVHKESNQFFDATTKPVAVVFFGVGVFSNFCFIFFWANYFDGQHCHAQ